MPVVARHRHRHRRGDFSGGWFSEGWGLLLATSGYFSWPPVGTLIWPPVGTFSWPRTWSWGWWNSAIRRCSRVLNDELTVSEFAARSEVTRQTLHRWLRRYAASSLAGLVDQSTVPAGCPHQMAPEVEAAIVELRRQHPGWGPRTSRPSASGCGRPRAERGHLPLWRTPCVPRVLPSSYSGKGTSAAPDAVGTRGRRGSRTPVGSAPPVLPRGIANRRRCRCLSATATITSIVPTLRATVRVSIAVIVALMRR